MIKNILELNFPTYMTLETADVLMKDMEERTITTQVAIDGSITPKFTDENGNPLAISYMGEKYVLKKLRPQASKKNTSLKSQIDLSFHHWAEAELQRFFFVEMSSTESGTPKEDNYEASLSLKFTDFIIALNRVLEYYFDGRIVAVIPDNITFSDEVVLINISYTYIWTLIKNTYKTFGVRWRTVTEDGICKFMFGFPDNDIAHIFQYGFTGGLLEVERQVQDDDIHNILLGRGSDKNLPYRYFKDVDPQNPSFNADPDWIPELKNLVFDGLRDAAFRSYVQGWKAKHYNGTITEQQSYVTWAWRKGYTDEKWDPVEYVADEIVTTPAGEDRQVAVTPSYSPFVKKGSSIDKYGALWGGLDKNEEIKPTIQGMILPGIGRADEVVDVQQITEDVVPEEVKEEEEIANNWLLYDWAVHLDPELYTKIIFHKNEEKTLESIPIRISVPDGYVANVIHNDLTKTAGAPGDYGASASMDYGTFLVVKDVRAVVYDPETEEWVSGLGIGAGEHTVKIVAEIENTYDDRLVAKVVVGKISLQFSEETVPSYRTFDIWIKNIWQTEKGAEETDDEYVERVWNPILGNRGEEEAAVSFSTGWLANEDYSFKLLKSTSIAVHYDISRSLNGIPSHWRLTLIKSDAEFDVLGVYIPSKILNASAGDYFFFTGIDLPYLYYTEAEKRLTEYKNKRLDNTKETNPTWVVKLSKVRMTSMLYGETMTLLEQIKAGASFKLADKQFIEAEYESLYITSVTYSYKQPVKDDPYIVPDVEIVLSGKIETNYATTDTLSGEVDEIKSQMLSISSYIKTVGDRFLRKDMDDVTRYKLTMGNANVTDNLNVGGDADINGDLDVEGIATFKKPAMASKGVEFGTFVSGMYSGLGGNVDEHGNAEFESVRIRTSLETAELVINRLNAIESDQILTEADTIDLVEDLGDNTYGLYLRRKWKGYFTSQIVGNVIKGIINNLGAVALGMSGQSDVTMYTSWMRVNSVNHTLNYIEVSLYPDEETPAGKNFKPCELMNIARWGNDRDKTRQSCILLSSIDGRIVHLSGITKPQIDVSNYAATFGTLPEAIKALTDSNGYPLPLRENLDYAYIGGVITQDIIRMDFQGKPVVEFVDRGIWENGGDYYYESINPDTGKYETSDVWYMGCKYRCTKNLTDTAPAWNNTDWAMIEGNPAFSVDFDDTDYLFDPDRFNVTLTIVAKLYNIDVTDDILDTDVIWTRYSEDADGNERVASDNAWAIKRAGAGKSINLTADDVDFNGYMPKVLRYTATVTLRDGMGQATATESVNFEC